MPEYVYAVHEFKPENDDEIAFRIGERIEIVEKDDQYGDGWWSGRNAAGKIGLFPQSYTSPNPPYGAPKSPQKPEPVREETPPAPSLFQLQPLEETSEPEAPVQHVSSTTVTSPPAQTNGKKSSDGDGQVMQATMSDVQRAIEQLSRGKANDDASQSVNFSFTSEKDTDRETDTDFDPSDIDTQGDDWHKQARSKLAEKARRAVEEAEKLEQISHPIRTTVPPIDVELSEESEGEDEDMTRRLQMLRSYDIPEVDEEDERSTSASPPMGRAIVIPERDHGPETATATRNSFPVPDSPSPSLPRQEVLAPPDDHSSTTLHPISSPRSISQALTESNQTAERNYTPIRESFIALPSPSPSSAGGFGSTADNSKHSSIASSSQQALSPFPSGASVISPTTSMGASVSTAVGDTTTKQKGPSKAPPNEWTVNDVVEWLRSKGFDQDVCDKFIEQEITGDVLVDLDVQLLKSEIGIMAFGKRVRIANAITELRRPPSVNYSDAQSLPASPFNPQQSPYGGQPSPHYNQLHSRNASFSHSVQSSVNSPQSASYASQAGFSAILSPESPFHPGDIPGSPAGPMDSSFTQEQSSAATPQTISAPAPVSASVPRHPGLGIDLSLSSLPEATPKIKARPAQLNLSPSDGAINKTAKGVTKKKVIEERDEEKGVMSETELPSSSHMRRRLFGRSRDSASLKEKSPLTPNSRNSYDGSISPVSAGTPEPDKSKLSPGRNSTRRQRSIDGARASDRLSIFNGLGSTIGKSRKPPPRYSMNSDDLPAIPVQEKEGKDKESKVKEGKERDKHSTMSISRLYHSNSSSKKSGRHGGENGRSVSEDFRREPSKRDPQLLRKRTSSYGQTSPNPANDSSKLPAVVRGPVDPLKAGQSILKQIGDPDHCGWMRKKGDRYNHWKLRYFVLKGPHLYCLRSNSTSETKIKGYINIVGYKVVVDENINPGKYGFRIVHDHDRTHYFSHDEKSIVRDWMKAVMKATIGRDYTKAVVSSCNIPTIPLTVAQAMNPPPRPPSPTARDATQKAMRRENPHQLSSRDAQVLMGLPGSNNDSREDRVPLHSFFSESPQEMHQSPRSPSFAPPRPSREQRQDNFQQAGFSVNEVNHLQWANSHLPDYLQMDIYSGNLCGGLGLLRIAESIKGRPASPPVPDSFFPTDPNDDKLDGLFRLFDFMLDNDVKMGSVSINDIRQGQRDKILQIIRALKAWEDKRRAVTESIGLQSVQAGAFMAPAGMTWSAI